MVLSNAANWIDVRHLAIEMHGHDCSSLRSNGSFDFTGIHRKPIRINIHKYWTRARIKNCRRGRDERTRYRYNLGAITDAKCQKGQVQGTGPRVYGNNVSRP